MDVFVNYKTVDYLYNKALYDLGLRDLTRWFDVPLEQHSKPLPFHPPSKWSLSCFSPNPLQSSSSFL